jgi:RNA polymerase sigma factor (sigma-70 family)
LFLFFFPADYCYFQVMSETSQQAGSGGAGQFVTTHWSAVIRAGNAESSRAQTDLAELCQAYWYPLYAFVRSRGHSPHDAEDLTQEFFSRFLAKNYIADAKQEKGKFRTFLLVALKAFLANEWDRQHAQKRGGFQNLVSIDQDLAESRFSSEPAHKLQPDVLFERQWALTLLQHVMDRLQKEFAETGRAELFGQLRPCLTKDQSALPYAEIGARLGQTEPGVRAAVHRLRVRYRELLREEIGKTVATPEELEQEIRYLISILG